MPRFPIAAVAIAGLLAAGSGSALAQSLTAADIQDLLSSHNEARCNVNPPARSMPALVWDANLAAVAQAWADQGVFAHNANRTIEYQALGGAASYVGENMVAGTVLSAAGAVAVWVGERHHFNAVTNRCATGACGHYTQVVWADTVAVGCGRGSMTLAGRPAALYVCDYAPGGNFVGRRPYQVRSVGRGTPPPAQRPPPCTTAPRGK